MIGIGINKERNKMEEIEIYKKILKDSEVHFEEGIVKKKGLSLKPYFMRDILSEEEIKKAKEKSEETRKKLEKMGVFGI
jgi:hypothetical protein